ncbi:hypothetical protein cyc_07585 [Cyclospora cayetanensis]|uniref:ODAD1 central coiled coil region domain-containing protein n=1 Tax=Cyclospora cayetanensis TaxID=88456 RepID=A0A1D3CV53_9EIME|nr:hypothetical protein cyc_07585 [Cyclospora cayetanensis]
MVKEDHQVSSSSGKSPVSVLLPHKNDESLAAVQAAIEKTTRKLELEKRKLQDLADASDRAQAEYDDKRVRYSFNKADALKDFEKAEQHVRMLENRVAQAASKHNMVISAVSDIRTTIDKHRKDRLSLEQVHRYLAKELEQKEKELRTLKVKLETAQKEEQTALTWKAQLIQTNEKERQEYRRVAAAKERDLREHDRLLKELEEKSAKDDQYIHAQIKNNAFSVSGGERLTDPETLMKHILKTTLLNTMQRYAIRQHRKQMDLFERAMKSIKESTGISDADEIVRIFTLLEERNYSAITYVNTLNQELKEMEHRKKAILDKIREHIENGGQADKIAQDLLKDVTDQIGSITKQAEVTTKQALTQSQGLENGRVHLEECVRFIERNWRPETHGKQIANALLEPSLLGMLQYVENFVSAILAEVCPSTALTAGQKKLAFLVPAFSPLLDSSKERDSTLCPFCRGTPESWGGGMQRLSPSSMLNPENLRTVTGADREPESVDGCEWPLTDLELRTRTARSFLMKRKLEQESSEGQAHLGNVQCARTAEIWGIATVAGPVPSFNSSADIGDLSLRLSTEAVLLPEMHTGFHREPGHTPKTGVIASVLATGNSEEQELSLSCKNRAATIMTCDRSSHSEDCSLRRGPYSQRIRSRFSALGNTTPRTQRGHASSASPSSAASAADASHERGGLAMHKPVGTDKLQAGKSLSTSEASATAHAPEVPLTSSSEGARDCLHEEYKKTKVAGFLHHQQTPEKPQEGTVTVERERNAARESKGDTKESSGSWTLERPPAAPEEVDMVIQSSDGTAASLKAEHPSHEVLIPPSAAEAPKEEELALAEAPACVPFARKINKCSFQVMLETPEVDASSVGTCLTVSPSTEGIALTESPDKESVLQNSLITSISKESCCEAGEEATYSVATGVESSQTLKGGTKETPPLSRHGSTVDSSPEEPAKKECFIKNSPAVSLDLLPLLKSPEEESSPVGRKDGRASPAVSHVAYIPAADAVGVEVKGDHEMFEEAAHSASDTGVAPHDGMSKEAEVAVEAETFFVNADATFGGASEAQNSAQPAWTPGGLTEGRRNKYSETAHPRRSRVSFCDGLVPGEVEDPPTEAERQETAMKARWLLMAKENGGQRDEADSQWVAAEADSTTGKETPQSLSREDLGGNQQSDVQDELPESDVFERPPGLAKELRYQPTPHLFEASTQALSRESLQLTGVGVQEVNNTTVQRVESPRQLTKICEGRNYEALHDNPRFSIALSSSSTGTAQLDLGKDEYGGRAAAAATAIVAAVVATGVSTVSSLRTSYRTPGTLAAAAILAAAAAATGSRQISSCVCTSAGEEAPVPSLIQADSHPEHPEILPLEHVNGWRKAELPESQVTEGHITVTSKSPSPAHSCGSLRSPRKERSAAGAGEEASQLCSERGQDSVVFEGESFYGNTAAPPEEAEDGGGFPMLPAQPTSSQGDMGESLFLLLKHGPLDPEGTEENERDYGESPGSEVEEEAQQPGCTRAAPLAFGHSSDSLGVTAIQRTSGIANESPLAANVEVVDLDMDSSGEFGEGSAGGANAHECGNSGTQGEAHGSRAARLLPSGDGGFRTIHLKDVIIRCQDHKLLSKQEQQQPEAERGEGVAIRTDKEDEAPSRDAHQEGHKEAEETTGPSNEEGAKDNQPNQAYEEDLVAAPKATENTVVQHGGTADTHSRGTKVNGDPSMPDTQDDATVSANCQVYGNHGAERVEQAGMAAAIEKHTHEKTEKQGSLAQPEKALSCEGNEAGPEASEERFRGTTASPEGCQYDSPLAVSDEERSLFERLTPFPGVLTQANGEATAFGGEKDQPFPEHERSQGAPVDWSTEEVRPAANIGDPICEFDPRIPMPAESRESAAEEEQYAVEKKRAERQQHISAGEQPSAPWGGDAGQHAPEEAATVKEDQASLQDHKSIKEAVAGRRNFGEHTAQSAFLSGEVTAGQALLARKHDAAVEGLCTPEHSVVGALGSLPASSAQAYAIAEAQPKALPGLRHSREELASGSVSLELLEGSETYEASGREHQGGFSRSQEICEAFQADASKAFLLEGMEQQKEGLLGAPIPKDSPYPPSLPGQLPCEGAFLLKDTDKIQGEDESGSSPPNCQEGLLVSKKSLLPHPCAQVPPEVQQSVETCCPPEPHGGPNMEHCRNEDNDEGPQILREDFLSRMPGSSLPLTPAARRFEDNLQEGLPGAGQWTNPETGSRSLEIPNYTDVVATDAHRRAPKEITQEASTDSRCAPQDKSIQKAPDTLLAGLAPCQETPEKDHVLSLPDGVKDDREEWGETGQQLATGNEEGGTKGLAADDKNEVDNCQETPNSPSYPCKRQPVQALPVISRASSFPTGLPSFRDRCMAENRTSLQRRANSFCESPRLALEGGCPSASEALQGLALFLHIRSNSPSSAPLIKVGKGLHECAAAQSEASNGENDHALAVETPRKAPLHTRAPEASGPKANEVGGVSEKTMAMHLPRAPVSAVLTHIPQGGSFMPCQVNECHNESNLAEAPAENFMLQDRGRPQKTPEERAADSSEEYQEFCLVSGGGQEAYCVNTGDAPPSEEVRTLLDLAEAAGCSSAAGDATNFLAEACTECSNACMDRAEGEAAEATAVNAMPSINVEQSTGEAKGTAVGALEDTAECLVGPQGENKEASMVVAVSPFDSASAAQEPIGGRIANETAVDVALSTERKGPDETKPSDIDALGQGVSIPVPLPRNSSAMAPLHSAVSTEQPPLGPSRNAEGRQEPPSPLDHSKGTEGSLAGKCVADVGTSELKPFHVEAIQVGQRQENAIGSSAASVASTDGAFAKGLLGAVTAIVECNTPEGRSFDSLRECSVGSGQEAFKSLKGLEPRKPNPHKKIEDYPSQQASSDLSCASLPTMVAGTSSPRKSDSLHPTELFEEPLLEKGLCMKGTPGLPRHSGEFTQTDGPSEATAEKRFSNRQLEFPPDELRVAHADALRTGARDLAHVSPKEYPPLQGNPGRESSTPVSESLVPQTPTCHEKKCIGPEAQSSHNDAHGEGHQMESPHCSLLLGESLGNLMPLLLQESDTLRGSPSCQPSLNPPLPTDHQQPQVAVGPHQSGRPLGSLSSQSSPNPKGPLATGNPKDSLAGVELQQGISAKAFANTKFSLTSLPSEGPHGTDIAEQKSQQGAEPRPLTPEASLNSELFRDPPADSPMEGPVVPHASVLSQGSQECLCPRSFQGPQDPAGLQGSQSDKEASKLTRHPEEKDISNAQVPGGLESPCSPRDHMGPLKFVDSLESCNFQGSLRNEEAALRVLESPPSPMDSKEAPYTLNIREPLMVEHPEESKNTQVPADLHEATGHRAAPPNKLSSKDSTLLAEPQPSVDAVEAFDVSALHGCSNSSAEADGKPGGGASDPVGSPDFPPPEDPMSEVQDTRSCGVRTKTADMFSGSVQCLKPWSTSSYASKVSELPEFQIAPQRFSLGGPEEPDEGTCLSVNLKMAFSFPQRARPLAASPVRSVSLGVLPAATDKAGLGALDAGQSHEMVRPREFPEQQLRTAGSFSQANKAEHKEALKAPESIMAEDLAETGEEKGPSIVLTGHCASAEAAVAAVKPECDTETNFREPHMVAPNDSSFGKSKWRMPFASGGGLRQPVPSGGLSEALELLSAKRSSRSTTEDCGAAQGEPQGYILNNLLVKHAPISAPIPALRPLSNVLTVPALSCKSKNATSPFQKLPAGSVGDVPEGVLTRAAPADIRDSEGALEISPPAQCPLTDDCDPKNLQVLCRERVVYGIPTRPQRMPSPAMIRASRPPSTVQARPPENSALLVRAQAPQAQPIIKDPLYGSPLSLPAPIGPQNPSEERRAFPAQTGHTLQLNQLPAGSALFEGPSISASNYESTQGTQQPLKEPSARPPLTQPRPLTLCKESSAGFNACSGSTRPSARASSTLPARHLPMQIWGRPRACGGTEHSNVPPFAPPSLHHAGASVAWRAPVTYAQRAELVQRRNPGEGSRTEADSGWETNKEDQIGGMPPVFSGQRPVTRPQPSDSLVSPSPVVLSSHSSPPPATSLSALRGAFPVAWKPLEAAAQRPQAMRQYTSVSAMSPAQRPLSSVPASSAAEICTRSSSASASTGDISVPPCLPSDRDSRVPWRPSWPQYAPSNPQSHSAANACNAQQHQQQQTGVSPQVLTTTGTIPPGSLTTIAPPHNAPSMPYAPPRRSPRPPGMRSSRPFPMPLSRTPSTTLAHKPVGGVEQPLPAHAVSRPVRPFPGHPRKPSMPNSEAPSVVCQGPAEALHSSPPSAMPIRPLLSTAFRGPRMPPPRPNADQLACSQIATRGHVRPAPANRPKLEGATLLNGFPVEPLAPRKDDSLSLPPARGTASVESVLEAHATAIREPPSTAVARPS